MHLTVVQVLLSGTELERKGSKMLEMTLIEILQIHQEEEAQYLPDVAILMF